MTQVKTAHGHSLAYLSFLLITFSPPLSLEAFVVVGKAFSLFTGLNIVAYCEQSFVVCVYVVGVPSFFFFQDST